MPILYMWHDCYTSQSIAHRFLFNYCTNLSYAIWSIHLPLALREHIYILTLNIFNLCVNMCTGLLFHCTNYVLYSFLQHDKLQT